MDSVDGHERFIGGHPLAGAETAGVDGSREDVGWPAGYGMSAEMPADMVVPQMSMLIDGTAGLVWSRGGKPVMVFDFVVEAGKVVSIDLVADPERLSRLELTLLDE